MREFCFRVVHISLKMLERCVASLCNNVNDPENNISLHRIQFLGETCPIKQRRRNRWVNFTLERRKNWVPGKTSLLCSAHFTEDDFMRLNEHPKRPKFLVLRISSQLRYGLNNNMVTWPKWRQKQKRRPGQATKLATVTWFPTGGIHCP